MLSRQTGAIEHSSFAQVADHLRPGDLLVVNDTRVFPARLVGHRVPSGGAVECLLLRKLPDAPDHPGPESRIPNPEYWEALMHPGQKLKPGARVLFEGDDLQVHGEVLARHFHGRRTIRLWAESGGMALADAIEQIECIPLPPYIAARMKRQTAPAIRPCTREAGSVAARRRDFTSRTACSTSCGHVASSGSLSRCMSATERSSQSEWRTSTSTKWIQESYTMPPSTAEALTNALQTGRRIIAVGTTTTRALESLTVDISRVQPAAGSTSLFIHPSHRFRVVQGLITNFHLPRSSLLMLVAAFAGREQILAAYREAVAHEYRFYSYGDAMLIV